MGKVSYFFSGECYIENTALICRRFDGITVQQFEGEPDPQYAIEALRKSEAKKCAEAGNPDVYVHVKTMTVL